MTRKLTTNEFIMNAIKIHGNKYDYSLVDYINNKHNIIILCSNHDKFVMTPSNHTQGQECPTCADNKRRISCRKTNSSFVSEANEKHNNIYNYKFTKYKTSHKKVIVTCSKHGNFKISPANHLQGYGCRICVNEKMNTLFKKTDKIFITESNIIHSDKYDYSYMIYKNSHEKIKIICPRHGAFFQTPSSHLCAGSGCPSCSKRLSNQETAWLDYIGLPNDVNHRQVQIKIDDNIVIVDGYDLKSNTVYEYHGDFWHGNPNKFDMIDVHPITKTTYGELYEKTTQRENKIKSMGYKLIVIWESEWKEQRKSLLP